MKIFKKIVLALICMLGLYACTLFKKSISKPVIVAMPDISVPVKINSTAFNSKYVNGLSQEQIASDFLKNFESEAKITRNVTFKNEEAGADFIVKIISLAITESSKVEKISDEKSPYNGQEMVLNSVDCTAEVEITDVKKGNKKLSNCYNSKSRSEKLKNNRDLGDLIMGSNKDHTNYRTKLLADDICNELAKDVGRRVWVPISRRIARAIK